jgi:hypothetical protein
MPTNRPKRKFGTSDETAHEFEVANEIQMVEVECETLEQQEPDTRPEPPAFEPVLEYTPLEPEFIAGAVIESSTTSSPATEPAGALRQPAEVSGSDCNIDQGKLETAESVIEPTVKEVKKTIKRSKATKAKNPRSKKTGKRKKKVDKSD